MMEDYPRTQLRAFMTYEDGPVTLNLMLKGLSKLPDDSECYLLHFNLGKLLHCSFFSHLESIHSRAVRIIFNLDPSLSDAECFLKTHWPSISSFYKKSVLIFMHKVYFDSLSFLPVELVSKKVSSRSLRAVNQMVIPRPRSDLGRNSLWYRGPVI